MKIGLSYDLREAVASQSCLSIQEKENTKKEQPEDALEEYDSIETIEALKTAIEARGHSVVKLGGGREFLSHILQEKVDFVFNISEGLGSYRSREAQVPSVLEMLGIPYSGADPQCLAVCLDKNLTKKIVSQEGICTPRWFIADNISLKSLDWKSLPYPVFIKPVWEGSSKGIRYNSLVAGPQQMEMTVSALLQKYQQPIMVEEFVIGEEITVGVIGNNPPRVMGIMRILPKEKDDNFIYSLETKRDYEKLVEYECPAKMEKKTLQRLQDISLQTFQVLGCRDFARLDFRVSRDGTPYFLEVNPLAGLNPRSSDLVIMARLIGLSYSDLIGSILDSALNRYE